MGPKILPLPTGAILQQPGCGWLSAPTGEAHLFPPPPARTRGRLSLSRSRITVTACQSPPAGVSILRRFSSAAAARAERCISSAMTGRSRSARAASFVVLPQTMVNGTGNFILLAVPFFILAGLIMERGGISVRLVRFIYALVGHWRGGLLQVTVASMYIVSGLSGSKPADVAAVGTVMRDQLRERHGAAEGAAVLAASAIMGETVPPSIAMLIVGSITSVSLAALFIGGLIPAAVMAFCLMVLIYVRARRAGTLRVTRASFAAMFRAGLDAVLPLLMPAMLLGGILFGVATPTEVAAFAVVYGLVLAIIVYRVMNFGEFMRTVADTAALTGVLLFIFAAASGFSWTLTVAYLPQRLVAVLHAVGNSTEKIGRASCR